MKPKTILIVLLVALAISGIILYFIKQAADKKKAEALGGTQGNYEQPKSGAGNTNTPAVVPIASGDYPIIYNRFSEAAKPIQAALGVTQDGIPGPKTLAEWKKYRTDITERFRIDTPQLRDVFVNQIKVAKQQAAYLAMSQVGR
jgi:murein L,D-transpeptidase YcbB/YkuD